MWMDASHILHAATSQLKWWLCAFTLSGGLPAINLVTVWWMRVSSASIWGGEVLDASAAGYDDYVFMSLVESNFENWRTGFHLYGDIQRHNIFHSLAPIAWSHLCLLSPIHPLFSKGVDNSAISQWNFLLQNQIIPMEAVHQSILRRVQVWWTWTC